MMFLALVQLDDSMSYGERVAQCLIIAAICMAIVFLMLMLLWGIVALFKFLPKNKEKPAVVEENNSNTNAPKEYISVEDIKDEDMMVAALVATIDYHDEVKEDVRVVSIKEI